MKDLKAYLSGHKTYVVAFLTAVYGFVAYYTHHLGIDGLAEALLSAGALAGIRSSITAAVVQIIEALIVTKSATPISQTTPITPTQSTPEITPTPSEEGQAANLV